MEAFREIVQTLGAIVALLLGGVLLYDEYEENRAEKEFEAFIQKQAAHIKKQLKKKPTQKDYKPTKKRGRPVGSKNKVSKSTKKASR